MQQYVIFNVLKEYCIPKEEEEEVSNSSINRSQLIKNTNQIWKQIEKNLECLRAFQRILNDQPSQIWT